MTGEEANDLLVRIDQRVGNIITHLEKLNGKVASHEKEINRMQIWQATQTGHSKAVNSAIYIFLTVTGIIVGALVTWQFH